MIKTTRSTVVGGTATNLSPALSTQGRPDYHHIKPRHVWKGRVWLLLKPYQRIHILERIAGKAVIQR